MIKNADERYRIQPTEVNTDMIGCIDGRQAIFVFEFNSKTGAYEVQLNTEQLKTKNYVEVLGAAFGFVAVAEVKLGLNRTQAFNLVEKALARAGYKPTFHADTHTGDHQDITEKLQELYKKGKIQELVELILKYLDGCGFAVYQWQDKAREYILEAIKRGWLIQILTGNHEESKGGAHLNYKKNKSLSVVEANQNNSPEFTQDMWFVALILNAMQKLAKKDGIEVAQDFETDALQWFADTFAAVVVALGGVTDAGQIKVHS